MSVTTVGGGCYFEDHVEVVYEGGDAVVLPYDRRHIPGENEGCIQILVYPQHVASLRFDSTGTKTIRVRGIRTAELPPRDSDAPGEGEVIDVPFTITVN
ncbi:MAG TPA: hypothetical protein VL326_16885 [Kofleriaceae bacterium]|nr:hypothetical protein [Kofleriaceae bacterium]